MDQINSLSKQGIRACWLDYNCESGQAPANEDSSDNEDTESQGQTIVNVSLDDIIQGKYTLIYAHPEALLSTDRTKRNLNHENAVPTVFQSLTGG